MNMWSVKWSARYGLELSRPLCQIVVFIVHYTMHQSPYWYFNLFVEFMRKLFVKSTSEGYSLQESNAQHPPPRMQNFLTLAKLTGLAIVIVGGIVSIAQNGFVKFESGA